MKGKWTFNRIDSELWSNEKFDTKVAAEEAGIKYGKENDLNEIAIGRCEMLPLPTYVDPEDVLDGLDQQMSEMAGEWYEQYLYEDVSDDDREWLEDELSKVIVAFNNRIDLKSPGYTVTDIYTVPVN